VLPRLLFGVQIFRDQSQPRVRPLLDVNSGPRAYRLAATFDPHLVVAGREHQFKRPPSICGGDKAVCRIRGRHLKRLKQPI
jgi:hypothetical protein